LRTRPSRPDGGFHCAQQTQLSFDAIFIDGQDYRAHTLQQANPPDTQALFR